MCGICGFNWNDKPLINIMNSTLKHRGPDDAGYYIDDGISLGHTRLNIIDLSERGRQPIHNENESIWIIFNGEIFNYKSLKLELEKVGHHFYTETDTEVIVHSYEEYGKNCLNMFNGQFAFCIYDRNRKQLFLARDRFGIKPLYYSILKDRFIFASEIKAILKYKKKKSINKSALREYFTYRYSIAPNTLFKGIEKLKPSNYGIYDLISNNFTIKRYFEINNSNINIGNSNKLGKYLSDLLIDSIKLRMIADVPVACFLSGGIDSSIITGIASKFNPEINTFSVGFETSSELEYAKIISEYFNTNHHELIISNNDIIPNIDKLIYHMEEPIGDPGFFPTLLLSNLASKYNKVVLAGEGADEIFGGYDKYKMYYYGQYISPILPSFEYKNEILKRIYKLSKCSENQGYLEVIRVFNNDELLKFGIEPIENKRYWLKQKNVFQKMQFFDIKTLLPEDFFMKADKMSSAYGLEERVPYMDHRLVEFAVNLPVKLKLHFWNEKYLLKKIFSQFLPKIIIKRRKRGYNVPIDHWFKKILDSRLKDLLNLNQHELYDKDYVLKLLNKIKNSGTNYKRNFYLSQKLWTIFIFEEWYNAFILN